jgi:hypothetical protein
MRQLSGGVNYFRRRQTMAVTTATARTAAMTSSANVQLLPTSMLVILVHGGS